MQELEKYPTALARHLYLYAPIKKDLNKVSEQAPDIFEDIVQSFCVRNHVNFVETYAAPWNQLVVVVTLNPEQETLELYKLWHDAWSTHGYASPILDIAHKSD